jgi:type I restriction enzyme, S subunit
MNDLPPGWAETSLGNVATLLGGSTPKGVVTAPPGDIPFYKVSDMNASNGNLMAGAGVTVSPDTAAALSLRVCPAGTVIFPKVGGALHTNKKRILGRRAAFDTNTMAAVPTPAIQPMFLFYWLCAIRLSDFAYGAPVPQVSRARLAEVHLALPPLMEQKRIVEVIEEQLSRVDAGVAALHRVRQSLKRFRAAVLQAAVTGQLVPYNLTEDVEAMLEQIAIERRDQWKVHTPKTYKKPAAPNSFPLTLPDHWRIASLEALTHPVRVICYGILMPKENVSNGVPYVRVKDMRSWTIDVPGLKRTAHEIAAKYARASLRPGDLLLAIRGSYGRAAIVPSELDGANITQDSARIAAHEAIDRRYLLFYLGGSVANRYYQRVARGVAVRGVNIGDLRSMPVPVPPHDEQVAIANEVERQFTLFDQIEATVDAAMTHASSLRSSVLAAALSGQLVSQDPKEEPASILLERTAYERAALNGSKRSNKAAHNREVTA